MNKEIVKPTEPASVYSRPPTLLQTSDFATSFGVPEWQRRLAELSIEPDSDVLGEIAATIPEDKTPETLETLAAGKFGDAGVALGRLLIQHWATNDVVAAATWAAHLPDGEFGRMICQEIVAAWAQDDVPAATSWVRQLPANGNRTAAQLALSFEASRHQDVATAVALAMDAPPGANRDEALEFSTREWAIADPDAATSWAGQMPNTALRDEILSNIATDLAVRDPFHAAKLLADTAIAEKLRDKAVVTVVRFWASSAPERAADWTAQFPESSLHEIAMKNLIDVWAKDDFAHAGEWLARQPDSPARNAAMAIYESARPE